MILSYLKLASKHSLIYGIGNILGKVIAFLLIPIYTRKLSVEDYGILSIMNIIMTVLTILLTMGLQTALFRYYIYDYHKVNDRKKLISTIIFFQAFCSLLITLLLILFSDDVSMLIFKSLEYSKYLKIIFASTFFEAITMISFSILRAKEKSKIFSIFTVTRLVLQVTIILYFVLILNQGLEGALKGILISLILFFFVNIPNILKNIKFTFSIKILKDVLRFGIPLIPAALGGWIMTTIDRFFVEHYSGFAEVGIYTLGYNLGLIINFVFVSPIQLAWPQIKWTILKKEGDAKRIYSYIMTYYILFGVFVCLALSLFSEEIIKIFTTSDYYSAISIIPIIALSYVLNGIFFMLNIGINMKKKTELNALIMFGSALINVILNFILIPKYSIMGAAASTLASYFVLVILSFYLNGKYYKVKYQISRITKLFFSGCFVFVVSLFIPSINIYADITINILFLVMFVIIIYLLKFFEDLEILKMREISSKYYLQVVNKLSKNG